MIMIFFSLSLSLDIQTPEYVVSYTSFHTVSDLTCRLLFDIVLCGYSFEKSLFRTAH